MKPSAFARTRQRPLLAVAVVAIALLTAAGAQGARSHLDAACEFGPVVDETSETSDVVRRADPDKPYPLWFVGEASAASLRADALTSADGTDGTARFCDGQAEFANTVTIGPGSTGLAPGTPITLALTVELEGGLSANVGEPPTEGPASEYHGWADVSGEITVTAPDRETCVEDDGRTVCRPTEIARFLAWAYESRVSGFDGPPGSVGTLLGRHAWTWVFDSNRTGSRTDSGDRTVECAWYTGGLSCPNSDPIPPAPDYRGTRTVVVDALVGDRLDLAGQLAILAAAQHGFARAAFAPLIGTGLRASLVPGTGFEGLQLTWDVPPPPASDTPPACVSAAVTTDEDTAFKGPMTCKDEDQATLAYAVASGPTHGQASVDVSGAVTYVPAPDWNGVDAFQVTARDAGGQVSQPATVTVTVRPVNDRPSCVAGSLQAVVGQTAQLVAGCTDADGDPLTALVVTQGSRGTASATALTLSYLATAAGADTFSYAAGDGALTSAPATVAVTVAPAPASMSIVVLTGLVVFRDPPDDDRARFTGRYTSSRPLVCGEDVTVSLGGTVFRQVIPGSSFRLSTDRRYCSYTRPANGSGGVKRVLVDLVAHTFAFALRDEAQLSALTNPVAVGLSAGDISASQTVRMTSGRGRWTYAG